MKKCSQILRVFLYRVISFIARIYAYYMVSQGMSIVSPDDVIISTSLIYKGKIAPKGFVFYIAKLKLNGVLYSKNVAVNRKNIPSYEERFLIRKCQRIFANGITKRLNNG